jgi:ferredoxin/flavodoxin
VAKLIALGLEEKGIQADLVRIEDLKAGKYDMTGASVIGIGAPIYGGFAEPIKDWAKNLDFAGKRVFLFSTAGIAHFGSTKEMIRMVERNNGNIIGAFEMTFRGCMDGIIYSKKQSEKYPLHKKDLRRAIDFGREVADIVKVDAGYVDSTYKHNFEAATLAIIRVIKFIVLKMVKVCFYVTDSSKCIACMKCEKGCPSGAVRVKEKKPIIVHGSCISCFKCFKECPQKALSLRFIADRPYYRGPWQLEGYIDPARIKENL